MQEVSPAYQGKLLGDQFISEDPPFTEGCAGANKKASPPGRQQRCTFSPTTATFSSVQFSSVQYSKFSGLHVPNTCTSWVDHSSVCCRDYARTETSFACIDGAEEPYQKKKNVFPFGGYVTVHQRLQLAFLKVSPLYQRNLLGGRFIFEDPLSFTEGCDGVNYQTLPPGRSNKVYF